MARPGTPLSPEYEAHIRRTTKYVNGELRFLRHGEWRECKVLHTSGYWRTSYWFRGKAYNALHHRVVWFLLKGYWATELDHIDRNKKNNSIENLREVSHHVNILNQTVKSRSGYICLKWNKKYIYPMIADVYGPSFRHDQVEEACRWVNRKLREVYNGQPGNYNDVPDPFGEAKAGEAGEDKKE